MAINRQIERIGFMKLNILKNSSLRKRERKKEPIEQRLLKNTKENIETGCLEWVGNLSKFGHGRIGYRDKIYLTHRLAYEIYKGIIPKGQMVCHKCDNPKCWNPCHLFLGTQKDNLQDAHKKGRLFLLPPLNGERNPIAKLTNKEAIEIREKLKYGVKGIDLAKEYKVSTHVISKIKTGKTYNI